MKINRYTLILLVLALASISNALDCSTVKYAVAKSAFDDQQCVCDDDHIWLNQQCILLLDYFQVGATTDNSTNQTCEINSFYDAQSSSCAVCLDNIFGCMSCKPNDDSSRLVNQSVRAICTVCSEFMYLNQGTCGVCVEAIPNCVLCSDNLTCTQCFGGFLIVDGMCQAKPVCKVQNCDLCDANDTKVCVECFGAYNLSADGKKCSIPTCAKGLVFIGTECGCLPGFGKNGQACEACIQGCAKCNDTSSCVECSYGFSLEGTTCSQCAALTGDDNCVSCSGAKCKECAFGFSLTNSSCQAGQLGVSGFAVLDSGAVVPCPDGCQSCSGVNTCLTPLVGYTIFQGVTYRCPGKSRRCNFNFLTKLFIIFGCYSRNILSNGACLSCSDKNCKDCLSPSFCLKCEQGFTAVNGVCTACAEDCDVCDVIGPGQCDQGKCAVGFGITNSGFGQGQGDTVCSKCNSGCTKCDEDLTSCQSCTDGTFSTVDSETSVTTCNPCPIGCKKCSDNATCSKCSFGYKLKGTTCVKNCKRPCAQCVQGSSTQCETCFAGFVLSGTSCVSDTSCNGTSSCVACPPGFAFNGGFCYTCAISSITGCSSCGFTNLSACTSCSVGYYMENGACVACASSCANCASAEFCYEAIVGYFIVSEEDGVPIQCDSNCATCAGSPSTCTTCPSGWTLEGAYCQSPRKVTCEMKIEAESGSGLTILLFRFKFFFFIFAFARMIRRPRKRFCFRRFWSGSINLESQVTVADNQNPTDTLNAVNTALASGKIGGQIIQSSSTSASGFTPQQSTTNLGLILGVSIPLTVLFVALLTFIACKLSGDQKYKSVNATDKNYSQNEAKQRIQL